MHPKCSEHGLSVFVHEASTEDIERDKDLARKRRTLSKIKKFLPLKRSGKPTDAALEKLFGSLKKPNDKVDATLLYSLSKNAVDLLISEDDGLHKRAEKAGLSSRVLTVLDALSWLRGTYEQETVFLPSVEALLAYEIDFQDLIFDGLRSDYKDFDKWVAKCSNEHRPCWVVKDNGQLAAVVIRKDETRSEAGTTSPGDRVLKMCTFKVADSFRGLKLGEQLLKQVLWHAQRNSYDTVYVTAFPKQKELIRLLEEYGFFGSSVAANGERVFEKAIIHGAPMLFPGEDVLVGAHRIYPRYFDDQNIRKFVVPIWPSYHAKLFPEAAMNREATAQSTSKPGNTIKKVYLCNSPNNQLRAGDLIFFYVTKNGSKFSQTVATLGVIESVQLASNTPDVRRLTAKRSVFLDEELIDWVKAKKSVKVIDFLLIGHIYPAIPLKAAIQKGALKSHPQSIVQLSEKAYDHLRPLIPSP
jgi:predicted GNAT family N-acyltransferase